jgi:hypothetical protein
VRSTARAAIGTFTKKIQRQLRSSVSNPPTSGPIAFPKPAAPRINPPASPAFDRGKMA